MSEKKPNNLASISSGNNYIPKNNIPAANAPQGNENKEFDKLKAKLEDFKKAVLKKYPFTNALALIPGPASHLFDEEEGLPEDIKKTKPLHVLMLIPEDEFKNIPKIKPEVVKMIQETKENLWIHIKTEVDMWHYGLDSRFDYIDAVSAAYPIHDKGILGALRVANIHKTLVLRKFDKYITTYAIGGSLVRGKADKDSDVDTFVIIDDTDVKRMNRAELLERLRSWIYEFVAEANALAGVKNVLNVQVYLLTDFWKFVKDVNPVIFTFIRDGIPLYDRGTFIPWKRLLQMGQIKPSPEAVDLYMKEGERTSDLVKRRLMDAMVDVYYGIVTPTQAMFMLAGEAPPVPKDIVSEAERIFVQKQKVWKKDDLKTLEKAVKLFKNYEYGKLKEISGSEIDIFLKESKTYSQKVAELRKKLEKKLGESSAQEIYENVFGILKKIFGNKNQTALVKDFEDKLVKKGKINPKLSNVLKELVKTKQKLSSGKLSHKEVDSVKRDSVELIDALVDYAQRADILETKKSNMVVIYGNREAELVLLGKENFLVEKGVIRKIANEKLVDSNKEEFEKALNENKGKLSTKISGEMFKTLEKVLGSFEIVF